jgi:glycerol-3-phosphate dehydrogenase
VSTRPEKFAAAVVGGGVIGCAVLFELTRRGVAAVLLEAAPDLCEGTSKANSAILHTGFDSKPGTIESAMLRRAAQLWPELLDILAVPYLPAGALMLARTAEEVARLGGVIGMNAGRLGVETELLDGPAVRALAPYLADDVVGALSIPGEAIVDPFWLTRAFAEAAIAGGASVRLGTAVTGLSVDADEVAIMLEDSTSIVAEQVIDAAGLRADDVAALAGDTSFAISPRKGQFLVSEETFGVDRIVLPIPGPMGKGMLVTPIVFGGLLLGPTAVDGTDKGDRSTDPDEAARILAACRALVPAVDAMRPIRQFAGLRHVSSSGDFILRPSTAGDRLYLAAGIRSTGISTSPAVAERVADDVMQLRGWAGAPRKSISPPPHVLPDSPGEVVCLCRSISRGEVLAACRHVTEPRTLDAIKRRGGATFGDCQGNLCSLDVARIVASERHLRLADVEKDAGGSWMWLLGSPDAGVEPEPSLATTAVPSTVQAWDVVVVGGGEAGRAVASATHDAGLRSLVVERRRHRAADTPGAFEATVVGLLPEDHGWSVLAQTGSTTAELRAATVVMATGAYIEPREHRAIAGPRPAGVMTADLAESILAEGLLPGRRSVLVGEGRRAAALRVRLEAAGVDVSARSSEPVAIRGERRLEAVRVAGAWHEADTLILADRVRPQTFLLRSLGLVDGRPGVSAPVDRDGRLPLANLWAAGCCAAPSIDHDGCRAMGRTVGQRVAQSLESRS